MWTQVGANVGLISRCRISCLWTALRAVNRDRKYTRMSGTVKSRKYSCVCVSASALATEMTECAYPKVDVPEVGQHCHHLVLMSEGGDERTDGIASPQVIQ